MADKNISAVNLLPEYFKTLTNTKFFKSTIDQLIQPAQLESIDGYIGSSQTPTYKPSDVYISNGNPYQLDPALILQDSLGNITDSQGYDDLINEIATKGGFTNDLDRLLRTKFYSYDAHIDWDKLVNYQNYFWMPFGPEVLEIATPAIDINNTIVGKVNAEVEVLRSDGTTELVTLSNGMLISFGGIYIDEQYRNRNFFVEGIGTSIKLVPYDSLIVSESFLSSYPDGFDSNAYDDIPYDNDRELPNLKVEYVTINRASSDLNPWSRYNRWVHKDVIRNSALINGLTPDLLTGRAQRPIIEFKADIKLFNFGVTGIVPVDLMDTKTTDPFGTVEGATTPVYVDGVLLENGHRVIFNEPTLAGIKGKVYEVVYIIQQGVPTLTLKSTTEPVEGNVVTVLLGNENNATEWWYDGTSWQYAQQRTTLNQAPLFDLFDKDGHSYGDKNYYLSNFVGNKIFSYATGTGTTDPYLGFPISYRNINTIGSILFDNNLCTDRISVSQISESTYNISSNSAYIKINNEYKNAWTVGTEYPIPVLSSTATGILSYYEEPLGLTNNPLNGVIDQFTISELSQHVNSMVIRLPLVDTTSLMPLRDRHDYTNLGTTLISNDNPVSFAQMFIGKKEHDLIFAIQTSAENYNRFKISFLNLITSVDDQMSPADAVDLVLSQLNQDKVHENSYYLSDMVGYGTPDIVRSWNVDRLFVTNSSFPLPSDFDLTSLSLRAVYVYKNGIQLVHGLDYIFNTYTTTVDILTPLIVGDVISVKEYTDTSANYIPLTPTKLGLYPKFTPSIFADDTYTGNFVTPPNVIQGHDGSITIAYNDYRDQIILELEKRIYNNIKAQYNPDLFDINSMMPGAFKNTEYSLKEVNQLLEGDFVKWASKFGIDYVSNTTFDINNSKTWNFYKTYIPAIAQNFSGSFRAAMLWLYGTDKPHIAPWEMLGIYEKPTWWELTYGPAPYTLDNSVLWADIEYGNINGVINPLYARPGLSNIIPVDNNGDLVDFSNVITNITDFNIQTSWAVGDVGPSEAAWRRSSDYAFTVQKLLALTKPADYTAHLYDPSRVKQNLAGQWTYGSDETFFNLTNLAVYGENDTLTSGYSAFISEIGQSRDKKYLTKLRQDLNYADYRLFCKLNGYADKNTLQIIIDAYEPTSTAPGSVLPAQNYTLRFNKSNPLVSLAISGIIVQKVTNGYSVKGYDRQDAYFNILKPLRNLGTQSINIGGVSERFVEWHPSGSGGGTNLSNADTTSASAAPTGNFYQVGQYVKYSGSYYRTTVAHRAGSNFNPDYFQRVAKLPTKGGASVQLPATFDQSITVIPYGTTFTNIQDVYDVIVGYGHWLESQGFIFDKLNSELNRTMDWNLSADEFLFWTTQSWDDGSIVTLSPFADSITLQTTTTVVDNLFDSFYDYTITGADGSAYPKSNLTVSRETGVCLIQTAPNTDGIYFARLNLVQKDHTIVFDNTTIFGDVIYNNETGNRQHRVKLIGFRTANWDGGLTSPGFIYDKGEYTDWAPSTPYILGDVVRFNGKYYSANRNIERTSTFNFTQWDILNKEPVAGLLPNFDYKISQFEDFYSLNIDNFDAGQQKLAQHLTGYTPRVYLNNIFPDPIAQYKFYQGFIREKGTQNAISKIAKISKAALKGDITYNEEWAFRVGHFGSFRTFEELETPLIEGTFLENPQIFNFVSTVPAATANDLIHYVTPDDLTISPDSYNPSNTFASTTSTDSLLLQHSGYVRIGDVTATAYNENSLLDIANAGQLKDGNTIWLGFKSNGDWDVYKYTFVPAEVAGVFVSSPLSAITFTTNYAHGLSVGQIIGINQFNSQVDGIYKVTAVNNLKQFTVSSTLASITNAPLPAPGQLYVFESVRTTTFDSLPSDDILYRAPNGSKYWIDGIDDAGWEVYEKINNYVSTDYLALSPGVQKGKSISKRTGSDIILVGSPNRYSLGTSGGASFFEKQNNTYVEIIRWKIGPAYTGITGFGETVFYDDTSFTGSKYGLVFVGAPLVDNQIGVVKVSSINSRDLTENIYEYIINPDSGMFSNFGKFIFVERNAINKMVLIGSNTAIHSYIVKDDAGTILSSFSSNITTDGLITALTGSDDASVIVVGTVNSVKIYNKTLTNTQTINIKNKTVSVSSDGTYIFIGNTTVTNDNGSFGQVVVYKNVNGTFVLDQVLHNPVSGQGMNFGSSIDITTNNDTLVISATGINHTLFTTFDKGITIFDGGITSIKGTEVGSGTVYTYYRKNSRFVYAQEITSEFAILNPGNNFGSKVIADDNSILVTMPAIDNSTILSGFIEFSKIDTTIESSLKNIVKQDVFVDVNPINRIAIIDTDKDQVIEYLDIFDPLKGRIPGIAEQELSYKLISDPAVYSIGVAGTNVDTNKNWLDDQVGKLWWDLSTAKYQWYEQGDLEYRKNNWGKLFPGATIDVYEWVGSTMLPSEWASKADTTAGLSDGISGQPKFADNSVISVKQVYDPITNSFTNVYYYWVKNKTVVPSTNGRRLSGYDVATVIADPTAYGISFAAVIDTDAIMLSNLGHVPVSNRISINIAQDNSTEFVPTPRHTQWYILEEGSGTSVLPITLEKKMIDSLLGHDSLGNLVPNPSLSSRTKYGIGIRPQQTMFDDRYTALRNIIEFANNILISVPIGGNYSFKNLNAQEEIPDQYGNTYDRLVEDNVTLNTIDTTGYAQAILNCSINNNGEVDNIIIAEPGLGYGNLNPVYSSTGTIVGYEGPTFTVSDASYITVFDNNNTTFDNFSVKLYTLATAPSIDADALTAGSQYKIQSVGTTDFTAIGASSNAVGVVFIATGPGTGTGTAVDQVNLYINDRNSPVRPQTRFINRDVPNSFAEGLIISTVVDDTGSVIKATVVNSGKRFGANFRLVARPQTVIVQSDDTYNGKWTRYEWDYETLTWNRAHTQSFNTTLYWDYVDYASADYNRYQIYSATVGSPYELTNLNLLPGQYVKVNNGGDGNYIILRKNPVGVYGTYGNGYDLVYRQNGTLQFKDALWRVQDNSLNWDYNNAYDSTLFDQTPNVELTYIFTALKKDLFIYDLKPNWNKLFFKAVRYALSEQKMLDWAFKTSFITLTHTLGELTQPPVYKIEDSIYYESYVNEVKPYHTQIREFITKYTITETSTTSTGLLSLSNTDIAEQDRTTSMELKFDRTSFNNQVGDFSVVDTFIADGITKSFDLSWVPAADKAGIVVKINGIIALGSQWTVDYTTSMYNGFHKQFASLVTLETLALVSGTTITVSYKKHASILNGTERVLAYYTSTYGTIGLDLGALVEGINYPGLEVGGQYEGVEFINPYGGVTADSLITGGTWAAGIRNTALGINPEDITITGEVGFINTFSGHAPSELLPGFVADSLGLNVYTVGSAQSPTIITGNVNVTSSINIQSFSLPVLPASVDNIAVVLNGDILEYVPYSVSDLALGNYTFSIDWVNKLILIPPQSTSGLLHYSLIGIGGGTNNFGFIDHEVSITNGSNTGFVQSSSLADVISDVYVTVSGKPTGDFVLDLSAGITGPATVTVNNLDSSKTEVIQVWFFTESHNNFNQIVDQISTTSTFELTSTGTYIVELVNGTNYFTERLTNSQFTITGTTITISDGIIMPGDYIKVVTFIDNTGTLGIETEEFVGNPGRRFVMNLPVSNDYYMWVSLIKADGTTYFLVNGVDFIILDDNVTIQVSDSWNIINSDTLEIISFKDPDYAGNVLGYRMFKDILGKTTYTRLSLKNTTYLTQPLSPTDTEIYVADASVLTAPIVSQNIPGVVLINFERIEFYQMDGNVLKQITRGTLGTGINDTLDFNTDVVDQGTTQEFWTSENPSIQYLYTTADTGTYTISKSNFHVTLSNTTSTILSNGITLNSVTPLSDQVDVYLGGHQLRKDPAFVHDTTITLDSISTGSIRGEIIEFNTNTLQLLNANPGDSYIDVNTGKVWTYTITRTDDVRYPGWVYSGLTKLQPEFDIFTDGYTQTIHLNNTVSDNLELAIVAKTSGSEDFNTVISPGTTVPLWSSTTTNAIFLKGSPTVLPKEIFKVLENALTDEQGRPLTNEQGIILTGKI